MRHLNKDLYEAMRNGNSVARLAAQKLREQYAALFSPANKKGPK